MTNPLLIVIAKSLTARKKQYFLAGGEFKEGAVLYSWYTERDLENAGEKLLGYLKTSNVKVLVLNK